MSPDSKTIVMLVTSEGLTDPRVARSMRAARREGFRIRLVCRAPLSDTKPAPPEGVEVHWVPRPRGWHRLRQLLARPQNVSNNGRVAAPAFARLWIRPWELWILGGIAWFTWQAVAKVRRHPAILYHANDFDTLPAGVFLSRLKKAPLLYDAHELFWDQFSGTSRQFRAILFGLEHWFIRFAHKVVTVNQSIAETLSVRHEVPMPSVVMNCPSAPESGTTGNGGGTPLQGGVARVIYQGIFMRDRGLEELIQSARWYESSELCLRGYGEHEPVLRELVKSEGVEGRVHFLPPADPARMVESLAGFDIGVVPYRATSTNNRLCLPNKVFEYLQAGLALAVSAFPELQRVVKETAAGEVFDPDNPRDIAWAINALTRDAGRLADLKARARAAGRERYTWEMQGEPQLLACYRELAGSPGLGAED